MKFNLKLVKAFTKNPAQGNPAGVILFPENVSDAQMIEIAKDLGFSESVFVFKSDKANYKLRFFTPTQEVDFCGHATIAAWHELLNQELDLNDLASEVYTQETKAGIQSVSCFKDGFIEMRQAKPIVSDPKIEKDEVADFFGINNDEISEYPLEIISTGVPKLLVPVKSLEILFKIKPNLEAIKKYCESSGARGVYVFTNETTEISSDFHARQFNPLAGIDEDPVTGVAAGALSVYAVRHKLLPKNTFIIEQGKIVGKFGKMYTRVIGDEIFIGGYAVEFN